jgi:hypothetical protein
MNILQDDTKNVALDLYPPQKLCIVMERAAAALENGGSHFGSREDGIKLLELLFTRHPKLMIQHTLRSHAILDFDAIRDFKRQDVKQLWRRVAESWARGFSDPAGALFHNWLKERQVTAAKSCLSSTINQGHKTR